MSQEKEVEGLVKAVNLQLWYARGFSARAKNVDYPRSVNFKGDRHREQAFQEGWAWANAMFHLNHVPYEVEEVVARENVEFRKATGRKSRKN